MSYERHISSSDPHQELLIVCLGALPSSLLLWFLQRCLGGLGDPFNPELVALEIEDTPQDTEGEEVFRIARYSILHQFVGFCVVSVVCEDDAASRLPHLRRTNDYILRARGFAYHLDLGERRVFRLKASCEMDIVFQERSLWLPEDVVKFQLPLLLLLRSGWLESRNGEEALG
ncbi:hypothetical protein IG631_03509 [Alternaria alternata]|nr:hypothetical protein IG631_03509 [Alternaria alternata]